MKRVLFSLLLISFLLFGCAGNTTLKMNRNYDRWMKQADSFAKVLCSHSEFSVCFWKSVLGPDINQLPHEAVTILEQIEKIIKGKKVNELTECEKATVFGLWLRFSGMVSADVIKRVTPYLVKFIGAL